MQTISTAIIQRVKLILVCRVPKDFVEVHNTIECTAGSNPCVHALPRGLSCRIEIRNPQRRDRAPKYRQPGGMDTGGNILKPRNELIPDLLLCEGGGGGDADVVDAFKEEHPPDTRLRDHVTVDAGDRAGAETICEDAVTASGLVCQGDVGGAGGLLEAGEQLVRPSVRFVISLINACYLYDHGSPIIPIRVAPPPIRDTVPHNHKCLLRLRQPRIHGADQIPVICTRLLHPA